MVLPNKHGFPTKNDHFGVFWGYHHLRKHAYVFGTRGRSLLDILATGSNRFQKYIGNCKIGGLKNPMQN